jgi:ABC-type dipeptide/oligopeptide/nickel transport system permease component
MNYTYILRRILIFIPTLFAISLIAFIISTNAPGDPVEAFFEGAKTGKTGSAGGNKIEADKKALRHELGLDLPAFYVTMTSLAIPDTFYKVGNAGEHENLERLIEQYGNWEQISRYYEDLKILRNEIGNDSGPGLIVGHPDTIANDFDLLYGNVLSLLLTSDPVEIESKLQYIQSRIDRIGTEFNYLDELRAPLAKCKADFELVKSESSSWKNFIPSLNFYGYNQYHRWLFGDGNMFTGNGAHYCKGVVRGDFGKSYTTKKPVTEIISRALPWSVFFTFVSVLLAYIISIPIGVQAAAKRGSWFDRGSSVVLFMLYSMPPFLMGIILLLLFANPDTWNIFPANGVEPATGIDPSLGWWDRTMIRLPYLILPIICYTYSSLAFLSRTVRASMLEVNSHDFMRTARAKGLTDRLLYYRHGLSNAMLPIITVFANVFPAAIGGSVVLEYLFGIPGMGSEILVAVSAGDFSVITAVFTLAGFMTLIGYLIADVLYSVADPRISFDKK